MFFYGFDADADGDGDFSVGEAIGNVGDDFFFTFSEGGKCYFLVATAFAVCRKGVAWIFEALQKGGGSLCVHFNFNLLQISK